MKRGEAKDKEREGMRWCKRDEKGGKERGMNGQSGRDRKGEEKE